MLYLLDGPAFSADTSRSSLDDNIRDRLPCSRSEPSLTYVLLHGTEAKLGGLAGWDSDMLIPTP